MMMLMLALLCVFASCNKNNPPEHTHSYGEWKIIKAATCNTIGSRERFCPCGRDVLEYKNGSRFERPHIKYLVDTTEKIIFQARGTHTFWFEGDTARESEMPTDC